MYKSDIDIAVLILFFNRPEPLAKVFAEVKKARPSHLYLYQDGPRGEKDMAGIEACRKIVDDIDWECDVQRLYQTENFGCDPSEFISQRWAFSMSDKCVVLEDDDIPSVSFFRFCKEMLDRYEDDERVVMVSGFNTDEMSTDTDDSYFFTSAFSIWGWASWARVVNNWDEHYTFLDNAEQMAKINDVVERRHLRKDMIEMCRAHRASGKAYYETIFWAYKTLHDGLAIMPKVNMINNLGNAAAESTHFAGSLQCMPRNLRKMFTMKRFEIDFPLKHPAEVGENTDYKKRLYKRNAWGHPWIKICYSMEELLLNLRYGNMKFIHNAVINRLRIFVKGKKYY